MTSLATQLLRQIRVFWSKHPALFLGLALLLGSALHFKSHPILGVSLGLLIATAQSRKTLAIALLFSILGFSLAAYRYPKVLLQEKVQGEGVFHIKQVKHHSSPFHRSILYKGILKEFEGNNGVTFKDFPCHIYLPLFGARPPANTHYLIRGTLCQKGNHAFVLKPEKNAQWTPLPTLLNLSEWRFHAKQTLFHTLKKEIQDPHARTFLSALATGDVDERILSMELGKVGLQHILAISGFHFALVALFLNFLLRLFLPEKISTALLLASLTFYYLFLGNSPSIQRAYIAIALIIVGKLFSLKISGINALGVGLLVEILFEPLTVTQLGFQLSFLCTLAILLYYPIFHRIVSELLPVRSPKEISSMPALDKHGFILSALLRKTLAVNLAVHLLSFPVLLHLFHKFPLLSIAYNLFFPACASICMLLLFSALFLSLLFPPFAHAIHALNNAWTSHILNLTAHPPVFLDFCVRCQNLPFFFVISFLTLSLFIGILFHEKIEKKEKYTETILKRFETPLC